MATASLTPAVSERLTVPLDQRPAAFRVALACALAFHGSLLLALYRHAPRGLGTPDGTQGAIAVELVSAADLESRETVALPSFAPPTPPVVAPEPPKPPAEPPAEKPVEPAAEPTPETPPAPKAEETAKEVLEAELPELSNLEQPSSPQQGEKPAEPKKPAETKSAPRPTAKPAPTAKLDLSPPAEDQAAFDAAPGRAASFTRPPGVTRSGENDEFGLRVIRALRTTMPPPSGIFGKVTVRLFLSEKGDLTEVRVLETSGISSLDQSVVFATRQTYFPLPPAGATVADRTFIIRYVYR